MTVQRSTLVSAQEFELELPSGRFQAQRFGDPDGHLVLCLPGLSANMKGFDFLCERTSSTAAGSAPVTWPSPRARGYFVIADRTKDLIKSGGEWISSVDMEAQIMAMATVVEAAVIAIPDPTWQERPLAAIVPCPGETVTLADVHAHLTERGWARWQLPDRVEIIEEVRRTSVGKFDKKVLRARFADDAVAATSAPSAATT